MLELLLMLGGNNSASPGIQPTLSGLSVSSLSGGACRIGGGGGLLIAAKVIVQWSVANPNDPQYAIKVYENGVLFGDGTIPSSHVSYTKTVAGSVEIGVPGESGSGQWVSNWTYRIDLVRLSDGVAVQSLTSFLWAQGYGVCS